MNNEWQMNVGQENASSARAVTQLPPDASVNPDSSQIIFQTKQIKIEIAALPNAFDDARFHMAGLDDPRIITPLGANITLTLYNQDGKNTHGWKLIRRTPPFANPKNAASEPPAFPGAEISPIPPHQQGDAHFTVNQPGIYTYICPELGDNDIGLYGIWEVAPGH